MEGSVHISFLLYIYIHTHIHRYINTELQYFMMMRMDEDASRHDDVSASAEVKEADKMMVKRVFGGEVDMNMLMDQESGPGSSSSEETESPRSVLVKGMRRWSTQSKEKNTGGIGMSSVHSQILRIRYEDSHVGEDISEVLSLFAKEDQLDSLMVFSKPILPSSPLGGKTIIKTSD